MLAAVENAIDTLAEAGNRNVPRAQLIDRFKKLSESLSRWYLSDQQMEEACACRSWENLWTCRRSGSVPHFRPVLRCGKNDHADPGEGSAHGGQAYSGRDDFD